MQLQHHTAKPVYFPAQDEPRRMAEHVREYWEGLKDGRRFPHESEVNPAVVADAWDHCFLAEMQGPVRNGFRYSYLGAALIDAYGADMTGVEWCDATTAPHVAMMLRQFDEVAESGEPAAHEAQFENVKRQRIKYRCCLLPLGRDRVEHILGCMRWRVE